MCSKIIAGFLLLTVATQSVDSAILRSPRRLAGAPPPDDYIYHCVDSADPGNKETACAKHKTVLKIDNATECTEHMDGAGEKACEYVKMEPIPLGDVWPQTAIIVAVFVVLFAFTTWFCFCRGGAKTAHGH